MTSAPVASTHLIRQGASAAWGALSGVAPHVLHHVGPLAGAAIVAGTTGRVVFFFLGLVAATPLLLRLRRRFNTWLAPTIAMALFAVTYTLSTLFIGPLVSDSLVSDSLETDRSPTSITPTTDEHGH